MQTATARKEKEDAVRQREREFEDCLDRVGNFERAIARLEPQVEKYTKQIQLVARIEAALEDLDPTINVGGMTGLVRPTLRDLTERTRRDQEMRLDDVRKTLERCRLELKQAKATLKTFED